jgi:hypothetical protein
VGFVHADDPVLAMAMGLVLARGAVTAPDDDHRLGFVAQDLDANGVRGIDEGGIADAEIARYVGRILPIIPGASDQLLGIGEVRTSPEWFAQIPEGPGGEIAAPDEAALAVPG